MTIGFMGKSYTKCRLLKPVSSLMSLLMWMISCSKRGVTLAVIKVECIIHVFPVSRALQKELQAGHSFAHWHYQPALPLAYR